jgi:uncharacterized protein (TIGR02996 family)
MSPIDNSTFAWLVYCDWLDENGGDAAELRAELADPDTNQWCFDFWSGGVGVDDGGGGVGSTSAAGVGSIGGNVAGVVGVGVGGIGDE